MALSMEEQRILAEIERGLAGEAPLLAARLSAFKHPGIAITLRLRRARLMASVASVIAVAAVSVVAYLFVPFAHRAPARIQGPGAPAITETGTKASSGTSPRPGGGQGGSTRQTVPGSTIGPVPGSSPGATRASSSGTWPGSWPGAASGSRSGAAGSRQDSPRAGGTRAPAVSRSSASSASAAASAPAK
jgi:Protein of unknown function (DUF3040)